MECSTLRIPFQRICNRDRGVYHECGECGKKYTTSSNLARHKQVSSLFPTNCIIFIFILMTFLINIIKTKNTVTESFRSTVISTIRKPVGALTVIRCMCQYQHSACTWGRTFRTADATFAVNPFLARGFYKGTYALTQVTNFLHLKSRRITFDDTKFFINTWTTSDVTVWLTKSNWNLLFPYWQDVSPIPLTFKWESEEPFNESQFLFGQAWFTRMIQSSSWPWN